MPTCAAHRDGCEEKDRKFKTYSYTGVRLWLSVLKLWNFRYWLPKHSSNSLLKSDPHIFLLATQNLLPNAQILVLPLSLLILPKIDVTSAKSTWRGYPLHVGDPVPPPRQHADDLTPSLPQPRDSMHCRTVCSRYRAPLPHQRLPLSLSVEPTSANLAKESRREYNLP
jgi:hypothetical protein